MPLVKRRNKRMKPEQIALKLVDWISQKVNQAGCKGVALGLSGGIDSAVLAVLCQRALPERTLAAIMPCRSSDQDREHALLLANRFSIPTVEINLDHTYSVLLDTLPEYEENAGTASLAKANLKPRLRMLSLYYIANQLNYLVAGASNRSELAIGYFTKYGDGGVDIMPLGSLVKAQVVELAKYLGVPAPIIEKPPSAGLWQGQTDEAEMGFSYRELDDYLLTGQAPDIIKGKIETMTSASRHKCAPPPAASF